MRWVLSILDACLCINILVAITAHLVLPSCFLSEIVNLTARSENKDGMTECPEKLALNLR